MWSQIVISSVPSPTISSKFRKKSYLPYAFAQHGVSMLASVLRRERAGANEHCGGAGFYRGEAICEPAG
jgi:hypothetical protein